MQRRYSLARFILPILVALVLTPLVVIVEAQAQITFASSKGGSMEIYVMDDDGGNLQNLTNNPHHPDIHPTWLNSPFSVSPAGKKFTMWGWLKQVDR